VIGAALQLRSAWGKRCGVRAEGIGWLLGEQSRAGDGGYGLMKLAEEPQHCNQSVNQGSPWF
jgi:hypothetical protein